LYHTRWAKSVRTQRSVVQIHPPQPNSLFGFNGLSQSHNWLGDSKSNFPAQISEILYAKFYASPVEGAFFCGSCACALSSKYSQLGDDRQVGATGLVALQGWSFGGSKNSERIECAVPRPPPLVFLHQPVGHISFPPNAGTVVAVRH
jgi:hypothetical protein